MIGCADVFVKLEVADRRISFELVLRRKVTVIRGNSATGKTVLWDMINRSKINPAVSIHCTRPVYALHDLVSCQSDLDALSGSVLIVDEDSPLYLNREFMNSVLDYNIWIVFITRDDRHLSIPFSMNEIYEFVPTGKVVTMRRLPCLSGFHSEISVGIITERNSLYGSFAREMRIPVTEFSQNGIFNSLRDNSNYYHLYCLDQTIHGRLYDRFYQYVSRGTAEISRVECFELGLLKALTGKNPMYHTPVECPVECLLAKVHCLSEYFVFLLSVLFSSSSCSSNHIELGSKCLSGRCSCDYDECILRSEPSSTYKREMIAKCVGIEKLLHTDTERVHSLVLQ